MYLFVGTFEDSHYFRFQPLSSTTGNTTAATKTKDSTKRMSNNNNKIHLSPMWGWAIKHDHYYISCVETIWQYDTWVYLIWGSNKQWDSISCCVHKPRRMTKTTILFRLLHYVLHWCKEHVFLFVINDIQWYCYDIWYLVNCIILLNVIQCIIQSTRSGTLDISFTRKKHQT